MKNVLFIIVFAVATFANQSVAQINQAADPGSTGMTFDKASLMVGETAQLIINAGNFGNDPIPAGTVRWTINIPRNVSVSNIVLPAKFAIVSNSVDPEDGTTVIILSNDLIEAPTLNVPAHWDILLTVEGAQEAGPLTASFNVARINPSQVGNLQTSNDNQTSPVTVSGTLPVRLVAFEVSREGTLSQLNWSTTTETNSDYFEVQHSLNAKSWEPIGTVKSAGESAVLKRYSFVHPEPAKGVNYYRLKMIDRDGTHDYSPLRSLSFEKGFPGNGIVIYPNPTAEKVYLQNADFSAIRELLLYSQNGNMVIQSEASPAGVSLKGLSSGWYLLKVVKKDGSTSSHKVVVDR